MQRVDLKLIDHEAKTGGVCPYIKPNIANDSVFYIDGEPVGFYMRKMPENMLKLADISNSEFRSKRVPKSKMNRSDTMKAFQDGLSWKDAAKFGVSQYSTILGSTPPRPHMRRPYGSISSVHANPDTKMFVKSMLILARESENLIQQILPKQYRSQKELMSEVPEKWRFGELFTSSISNYNISAGFHRDNGNVKGAVNVIICKRNNAIGGDLHIPDYDATIDQVDGSILVYPAWRNVHGVTPIEPTHEGGYRNTFIFYALKAFKNLE